MDDAIVEDTLTDNTAAKTFTITAPILDMRLTMNPATDFLANQPVQFIYQLSNLTAANALTTARDVRFQSALTGWFDGMSYTISSLTGPHPEFSCTQTGLSLECTGGSIGPYLPFNGNSYRSDVVTITITAHISAQASSGTTIASDAVAYMDDGVGRLQGQNEAHFTYTFPPPSFCLPPSPTCQ
jgi:hypothetical protein